MATSCCTSLSPSCNTSTYSIQIGRYLGGPPQETAVIWRAISEFSSYLQGPLVRIYVPLLTGKAHEVSDDLGKAATEVHAEFKILETSRASAPWLNGADLSAVDIAVYPFMKLLERAGQRDAAKDFELDLYPLQHHYPRLASWMEQIERLPGYGRTYPPHWRQ